MRHVLDVRHESFRCAEYLALARRYRAATVFTDSDDHPPIPDPTGDFVYTRMMRTRADLAEGCELQTLRALAACAHTWASGEEPTGLPRVEAQQQSHDGPRDVYMFFIGGAKEKAPAAALGLIRELQG